MRFREQLDIINNNIDAIKVDYTDIANTGNKWVDNTLELQEAIRNISVIGAFAPEMERLNSLGFSLISAGKISVPASQVISYRSIIDLMYSKAHAIKTSIELSLPEQDINTVVIGFPDFSDFSEMQNAFTEIQKSASMIFSVKEYKSDVHFQNFDSGTSWVEIVLGSSVAVGFLGKILKTLLGFVAQYQGIKANNLGIESLEMDNEIKRTVMETNKKVLNIQLNQVIENNFSADGIDTEDIAKISKASEPLLELLSKGVTFTPATSQVETIKSDFPSISELMKFQPQKLLEDSNSPSDQDITE